MPVRIQRKRTKGWRMPEGAIYVGRPSKWGNPFVPARWFKLGDMARYRGPFRMAFMERYIWEPGDESKAATEGFTRITNHQQAVEWFKQYRSQNPLPPSDINALRGHDLACWCRLDQPCHADILLDLVNH